MRKCLCSGRRARTAPISARPPPPKGLSPRLTSLLPLLHPAPATHPLTQSPPLPSLWRCAEYRRARSCMAGLQRMLSSLSPALRVLFCSTFSLYARLPVPSSSSSSFLISLSVYELLCFLLCTSRSPLRFFTVTPVTLSLQTLLAVFVSQNLPSSPHCTASPPFSPSLSLSRKASIINTHLWLSPKTEPRFRPSFSAFLITRNEREII